MRIDAGEAIIVEADLQPAIIGNAVRPICRVVYAGRAGFADRDIIPGIAVTRREAQPLDIVGQIVDTVREQRLAAV